MSSVLEAVREVLGLPSELADFPQYAPYIVMFEYVISGLLLLVVVASVFKILVNWSKN